MARVIDSSCNISENQIELSLRPQRLDEYIGQNELKKNLKIFIGAALNRDETLDHILLYGPPGLGKTTLANVIANEMHANIHVASGPSIEKVGDIAAILSELQPGDILFIDEIHRLPRVVEESLYTALEDFTFTIMINREINSKALTIQLPPFTLIGATTRAGALSSPLRARFGIFEKLNFYDIDECQKIIERTAHVFGCTIDEKASLEIAKRSRGTPRIANRLLKRVRDFANYENSVHISYKNAIDALKALRVDSLGLDDVDIKYLETLIKRFNGGPVGLQTLANSIGEEEENLEDVYEPYLIKLGFIDRTPKGRIANKKAYNHLEIKR